MTCPSGDILAMYAFLDLITLSAGVRLYKECLNVCHVGEKDESRPAAKFIVKNSQVSVQCIALQERAITTKSQSELIFLIIVGPRVLGFSIVHTHLITSLLLFL